VLGLQAGAHAAAADALTRGTPADTTTTTAPAQRARRTDFFTRLLRIVSKLSRRRNEETVVKFMNVSQASAFGLGVT
jgi:hypothetical protein